MKVKYWHVFIIVAWHNLVYDKTMESYTFQEDKPTGLQCLILLQ